MKIFAYVRNKFCLRRNPLESIYHSRRVYKKLSIRYLSATSLSVRRRNIFILPIQRNKIEKKKFKLDDRTIWSCWRINKSKVYRDDSWGERDGEHNEKFPRGSDKPRSLFPCLDNWRLKCSRARGIFMVARRERTECTRLLHLASSRVSL